MQQSLFFLVAGLIGLAGFNPARAVHARLLRQPDVSQTHITFVYAGDIWIVPKEGGAADVRVQGGAKCTVSKAGSGNVVCG